MKKLIRLFAVLILICGMCVGSIGCGKKEVVDPIVYTAEKPILQFEGEWVENKGDPEDGESVWGIKDHDVIKFMTFYQYNGKYNILKFKKYFAENLKNTNLYILDNYEEWQWSEGYSVYQNKITKEYVINEYFDVYDKEYGSYDCGDDDCCMPYTAYFDIYIKSINRVNLNELTFEFGKYFEDENNESKYFNVLANGECFATCYFSNSVPIPQEWYENYIKQNLIWGDDLTL